MNKKASTGESIYNNLVYLIIGLAVFLIILAFVLSQQNSASKWEDYYAKEISRAINSASVGDKIILDVQKATEVAEKNKIADYNSIFSINNENKEVCVKLSPGRQSCYSYFKDLQIKSYKIEFGVPQNVLNIEIGGENE